MKKVPLKVLVLVGGLPDWLTHSKITPIIKSEMVKEVYVFKREPWIDLPKCQYINTPGFFRKIKPDSLKIFLRGTFEFFLIFFYCFKKKPDVINGIYTIPYGLYSLMLAKIFSSKNIVSIIGDEGELQKIGYRFVSLLKNINSIVYRFSSYITTKGEKTKSYLVNKGFDKNKIEVFNGAIDLNKFFNKNLTRNIDILYVGEFSERKGPDRFVQILKLLRKKFNKINAVMVGKGNLFETIKKEICSMNLAEHIELAGYSQDVADFYNRSKLLIMPSRGEGLSTAMLEAMACGCVPIVSDVGNMAEAAIDGYNSRIVEDYSDVNKFSDLAYELLTRNELLDTLSGNAINSVEKKYSVEMQSKTFNRILESIVHN